MTIQRNLSGKVDESVRRTIVEMDARLTRFERVLAIIANRAFTNGGAAGLSAQQQSDVAGLIGILGQRLIAEGAQDPVLEQIGTGTVRSVTVAAGNQLTGGGSITSSGTITLNVTTTPQFSTVEVATQFIVAGLQVVNARKTGWGSPSGTLSRAAYAAYAGQLVSAAYVQAEAQQTDDALKLLAQVVAALLTDLHFATSGHGLIGA